MRISSSLRDVGGLPETSVGCGGGGGMSAGRREHGQCIQVVCGVYKSYVVFENRGWCLKVTGRGLDL